MFEEKVNGRRTDGRRTDDGRRVITIAHLVSLRLSGELKMPTLTLCLTLAIFRLE